MEMEQHTSHHAYLKMIAAAFLWALAALFRKHALVEIHFFTANCINAATIATAVFIYYRPNLRQMSQALRQYPLVFAGLSFFGVVLGFSLYYYGLRTIPLGMAQILAKLKPVFILVFARLILGERFELTRLPFLFVALVSAYVLTMNHSGEIALAQEHLLGASCIFASAGVLAFNGVLNKYMIGKGIEASIVISLRFSLGTALLLPLTLVQEDYGFSPLVNTGHLSSLFLAAGISTWAFCYYYSSLKVLSANSVGVMELADPLFAALMGVFIFSESFTGIQIIAVTTLVVSLVMVQIGLQGTRELSGPLWSKPRDC
jgi:drug/metabolite transporter (DMT)-like permease